MNRKDFQELAIVRLDEARALIGAGLWDGAYYLCGYSVKCGLKACIARLTQRYDFPDRELARQAYTHDLMALVRAARLDGSLAAERARPAFNTRWNLVIDWTEESRYRRMTESAARDLFDAVVHRRYGVLRWVRRQW